MEKYNHRQNFVSVYDGVSKFYTIHPILKLQLTLTVE
jgi:hypothetical protein